MVAESWKTLAKTMLNSVPFSEIALATPNSWGNESKIGLERRVETFKSLKQDPSLLSKSPSESIIPFLFSHYINNAMDPSFHVIFYYSYSFNPLDSYIWFELFGSPSDRDVNLIGNVSVFHLHFLLLIFIYKIFLFYSYTIEYAGYSIMVCHGSSWCL